MYSQGQEEPAILKVLTEPKGHFLDIGAYDGKTFSNTRALAERGWSGTLVECSPKPFVALQKLYEGNERVKLVCAAMDVQAVPLRLLHSSPDAVGTLFEKNYQVWKEVGQFEPMWVSVIRVEDLLAIDAGPFDLISIDTEGNSTDLFFRCIANGLQPTVYCVEHDNRHDEIRQAAARLGYRQIYFDGNNIIIAK